MKHVIILKGVYQLGYTLCSLSFIVLWHDNPTRPDRDQSSGDPHFYVAERRKTVLLEQETFEKYVRALGSTLLPSTRQSFLVRIWNYEISRSSLGWAQRSVRFLLIKSPPIFRPLHVNPFGEPRWTWQSCRIKKLQDK